MKNSSRPFSHQNPVMETKMNHSPVEELVQ